MPSGSLLKYFNDKGGPDHGGTLHWPGTIDGYPFRGEVVPNLTQRELEEVPLVLDYHARSFKMWVPEEADLFVKIMDRIGNGIYMQHKRFDNYVPEHMDYVVRLEWFQIYGEHPSARNPGSGSNVSETINLSGPIAQDGKPRQPPSVQQRPNYTVGHPADMGTEGTPY